MSLLSVPTHATLSNKIGPEPWPKRAKRYDVAPIVQRGIDQIFVTI